MILTASQALWLLPPVLPICLYVAWNDMRAMKIPNWSVIALVGVFAVFGLIAFGVQDWAWRWSHLAVMLVIGIVANAAGAMGAGDAKFIAAAAPFVAFSDAVMVMYILAGCTLAGFVVHRIARHSPIRRMVPDWESWTTGKRFLMGLPLGTTLICYLAWPIVFG